MADRDILFAVRNNFYIGAYNNAINEASDIEGLSEAEQTERDVYVYRSYIALGSHDVSAAAEQICGSYSLNVLYAATGPSFRFFWA